MVRLKNARILVTGGVGFIGSNLVKTLIENGAKVIVVDLINNPKSIYTKEKLFKKSSLELIDIRNKNKLRICFEKYKPQYVFHLAAKTLVEDSYHHPDETLTTNILGTINILEIIRNFKGIRGILVASSDKAYGKLNKIKYNEDYPLKGDHPYDVSKSATDLIANTYFVTYRLPVTISRFGNVYGPGDLNLSRIIPSIAESIIHNKILILRSNGKYIRDYVYVQDIVNGCITLISNIDKTKGIAYNFSSLEKLSVLELVKKAEKIMRVKIPYKILNNAKNEIPYQHLDDSRIKKLKWLNKYNLENTLQNTIEWYRTTL